MRLAEKSRQAATRNLRPEAKAQRMATVTLVATACAIVPGAGRMAGSKVRTPANHCRLHRYAIAELQRISATAQTLAEMDRIARERLLGFRARARFAGRYGSTIAVVAALLIASVISW